MNEHDVTELMIHVERIVRPVRAGQGRKLRMRLESKPRKAGFYSGMGPTYPRSQYIVLLLWLPTVLLAGLCWFAWRKTRPKLQPEWAFPVEPVTGQAPRGD